MDKHFAEVFRFLKVCVYFSLLYFAAITFIPIPEHNTRVADTIQGFLSGVVVSGIVGFFITGSPFPRKTPSNPGTATVDIQASVTPNPEDPNKTEDGNTTT